MGKNVDLRPLDVSDAEFILSLRLDPELSRYLNPVENNLDKQRAWIKTCMNDPQQWYFIIQNKKQEPVGTIRIYDIKDTCFCWGSFIVIPKARSYASFESLVLLYHYAFFELGFDYTNFDVRKKNEKALQFYLRFGAIITGETDEDFLLTYTKEDFTAKLAEYKAVIDRNTKGPA